MGRSSRGYGAEQAEADGLGSAREVHAHALQLRLDQHFHAFARLALLARAMLDALFYLLREPIARPVIAFSHHAFTRAIENVGEYSNTGVLNSHVCARDRKR